jgi:hypothetical protein
VAGRGALWTAHAAAQRRRGQVLIGTQQTDDKSDYEKYLAWCGENGSLARIVAMLDGKPTIRYFDKLAA